MSHQTKTRAWRHEEFVTMGFNKPMAKLLAMSRTDLHQARKMIEQGCPLETLTAIFLDGDEADGRLQYDDEEEE